MKKKRKKSYKKIIGIIAIVVFFIYFIYIIIATITNFPVNKILDDEPVYYFLCKIDPLTRVSGKVGCYTCDNKNHYTFKWLKEWSGYHGCNESTKGYNGKGKICNLSSCGVIRLT